MSRALLGAAVLVGLLLMTACATPSARTSSNPSTGPATGPSTGPSGAPTTASPPRDASSNSMAAATVAGQTISLAEVDDRAAAALLKVRRETFQARSEALTALIDERLIALASAEAGISPEEFVTREVMSQTKEPSDEELEALYDRHKARLGGRSFEEMRPELAGHLMGLQLNGLEQALLERLRVQHEVTISLTPPRVEVSAEGGFSRGPAEAPVTIVAFSDFQCPYCAKGRDVLEQVQARYPTEVRLVFRDFPLEFHDNAMGAAQAARCAGEQEAFWAMHDTMFENQRGLDLEGLVAMGTKIGLDEAEFVACLDSGRHEEAVLADLDAGKKVGVSGTPAFFINGIMLEGAQPLESFAQIIEGELRR